MLHVQCTCTFMSMFHARIDGFFKICNYIPSCAMTSKSLLRTAILVQCVMFVY